MPTLGSDALVDSAHIYTQVYKAVKCACWGGCPVNKHITALTMGESAGHLTVPFLAELHLENAVQQVSCISHCIQGIRAAGYWYECNLPHQKKPNPEQNREKAQGLDFLYFNFSLQKTYCSRSKLHFFCKANFGFVDNFSDFFHYVKDRINIFFLTHCFRKSSLYVHTLPVSNLPKPNNSNTVSCHIFFML